MICEVCGDHHKDFMSYSPKERPTCSRGHGQCPHHTLCMFTDWSDYLLDLLIKEPKRSVSISETKDKNEIIILIQGYFRRKMFTFRGVNGPGFIAFPDFLRKCRDVTFTDSGTQEEISIPDWARIPLADQLEKLIPGLRR